MPDPTFTDRATSIADRARDRAAARLLGAVDDFGFGDTANEQSASATWTHVPAKGSLSFAVLSTQAFKYLGHWVGHRMAYCHPTDCVYCERRMGTQVKYVLGIMDLRDRQVALIELTPVVAGAIAEQVREAGYLRGLQFELRHEGGVKNSKILCKPLGPVLSLAGLPEEPAVKAICEHQWKERGEL